MREYRLVERMLGTSPRSALGGAIVSRVLVQRRVEAKAEQIANSGIGQRRAETFAVPKPALFPLAREINSLEEAIVNGRTRKGPGTVGTYGMKAQFALPSDWFHVRLDHGAALDCDVRNDNGIRPSHGVPRDHGILRDRVADEKHRRYSQQ